MVRLLAVLVLAVVAAGMLPPVAGLASPSAASQRVAVIVRVDPVAQVRAERLVTQAGGRVGRRLPVISGFSATVPRPALTRLARMAGVTSVTVDGAVQVSGKAPKGAAAFGDDADRGTMHDLTKAIGAQGLWGKQLTGKGVDVALIDTGVLPVNGLRRTGKLYQGADLSLESQDPDLEHLDTNGHGTHMAGIIAGRDDAATNLTDARNFVGVAPDARLVSVKVGTASGAVDVSQLIAAIDWVIQHRRDNGLNIRVLNLSLGTDSVQPYTLDPLMYAAEVAWRKGITVVVAAGNQGTTRGRLDSPAADPFLLAVGASDTGSTTDLKDDQVAEFSSRGNGVRNPDLVAPGRSVASLRAPGSHNDTNYPAAVVGDRFFRGSGSSQAAAVVSGAAALLLQQRPTLTPDQLKALLTSSARPLAGFTAPAQGAGSLDLAKAQGTATPTATQRFSSATGTGSLEQARGTSHLTDGTIELRGEQDIFGTPFDSRSWAAKSLAGTSWSGGTFNGTAWTGTAWSGATWSGRMWSGRMWSGRMWSADIWSGRMWSGRMWSTGLYS
ncbi:MAG TPA: S8 family serine peptidase [Actinomycetes bacterium]|nr:S8 family serine peptidase [Actinomycetes bacterium]